MIACGSKFHTVSCSAWDAPVVSPQVRLDRGGRCRAGGAEHDQYRQPGGLTCPGLPSCPRVRLPSWPRGIGPVRRPGSTSWPSGIPACSGASRRAGMCAWLGSSCRARAATPAGVGKARSRATAIDGSGSPEGTATRTAARAVHRRARRGCCRRPMPASPASTRVEQADDHHGAIGGPAVVRGSTGSVFTASPRWLHTR